MIPSSLDNTKHNRNRYACGTKCVSGKIRESGRWIYLYARLYCKSWHCPRCGPRKAAQLRRAVIVWAIQNKLTKLMSLTLDRSKIPPGTNDIEYLRATWAKFRVYLKRKLGKNVSFIAVLDFQKSGSPHLHILIDTFIPQAWISIAWAALGGGVVVDIRRVIDLHRVAGYISRYLTKKAILSSPKGVRRYTTSRDVKLFYSNNRLGNQYEFPFMPKRRSGWYLIDNHIEHYYRKALFDLLFEEFDEDGSIRFFGSNRNLEN